MLGPLLLALAVRAYPAIFPGDLAAPPPPPAQVDAAAPDAAPPVAVPEPIAPAPDVASAASPVEPEASLATAAPPPALPKRKGRLEAGPDAVDDDAPALGTSGDPFGDPIRGEVLSFRLLMQARYADEWSVSQPRDNVLEINRDTATAAENDGWRMNRLFLRAIAKPRKWLQGRLLLDFAELRWGNRRGTVKLAYLVAKALPRTRVTVGFFKRPFSLLELLPIADFEFADVGPTDEVIKELGFGGRDMGAMVQVEPLALKRWMNVSAGMFAGDGFGKSDDAGLAGGIDRLAR